MTRPVYLRETRHDVVKAAIAYGMTGNESPAARNWAIGRWGEGGCPSHIDKAAESSSVVNDLDSTSTTGLLDRELFRAVRESSIFFRLRGMRRTGWRVRSILGSSTVATFVEEGTAIPVSKAVFDNAGLGMHKIAGITVVTEDTLKAAPGVEGLLFDDLSRAYSDELDSNFLDPSNSGTPGVVPASITSGITALTATSSPAADLAALIENFGGDLLSSYFITTPSVATKLAATGDHPELGARGGQILGIPALTSRVAPIESVILVDPTGFMAAYTDDILLEVGREGALEMDTAPSGDSTTPTAAQLVSLFATDTVAFRAIGNVSWKEARSGGVSMLQGGGSDWLDVAGVS